MKKSTSVSRGPESADRTRRIRSTTVLCVRRDDKVVMAGDGQVTLGESVIKHGAKKIRRLYQDKILAGFAGSPLMPSRSSAASKPSSNSITAISAAPRSNSPRTGAPTNFCATSKPCSSSPTKIRRFC